MIARDSLRMLATLWTLRQQTEAEWRKFSAIYQIPEPLKKRIKPQGPRWGQPGRRRRRKARFAARQHGAELQRLYAQVRALRAGSIIVAPNVWPGNER